MLNPSPQGGVQRRGREVLAVFAVVATRLAVCSCQVAAQLHAEVTSQHPRIYVAPLPDIFNYRCAPTDLCGAHAEQEAYTCILLMPMPNCQKACRMTGMLCNDVSRSQHRYCRCILESYSCEPVGRSHERSALGCCFERYQQLVVSIDLSASRSTVTVRGVILIRGMP